MKEKSLKTCDKKHIESFAFKRVFLFIFSSQSTMIKNVEKIFEYYAIAVKKSVFYER